MPFARSSAALFAVTAAGVAAAADPAWRAVTLSDGFAITGKYAREMEFVEDPGSGKTVKVAKLNGFDIIQDGPKAVIFSTHARRGGAVDEAAPPARTTYKTDLKTRYNNPVMAVREVVKLTEFTDRWQRVMETRSVEGSAQFIKQQVTSLDPYSLLIESPTDQYTSASHTTEEDPPLIRLLLSKHPDLRDPVKGKPDPERRLKIASFLKEVAEADGTRRALLWTQAARREVDDLKADVPPATWPAAAAAQLAKLLPEIDRTEAGVFIAEAEAAVRTGRYDAAGKYLAAIPTAGLNADQLTRLTVTRSAVEKVRPGYEQTADRLRTTIERESGMAAVIAHSSVAGAAAGLFTPRPTLSPESAALVAAAAQVLAELGPDTAPRLELFKDAVGQAELARSQGRSPADTPPALLAYAVSGWTRGRNGADADVAGALRAWAVRQMALDYLREPIGNNRKARLDAFTKQFGTPPAPDELAQIVTLLPPAAPMDLSAPTWKPVPRADADGVDGLVRLNTGPVQGDAKGVDYTLRLPPEYHHGRAYPVLLVLRSADAPAERMVARLAEQGERNGYILAAPEWTNQFGRTAYDYGGKDHYTVTAVLRDVLRRFQADPDRVFLFGFGAGADFAVDFGMAHPDLFAGVGGFGPNPPIPLSIEYWRNAQRLPMYLVSGEVAGTFPALRRLYEKWMFKGFPALLTIYRGRGLAWYTAEVPRMFDWMNRKTRVRGAASLRTAQFTPEPWQVLREADDRFYFVGVGPGGLGRTTDFSRGVPGRVTPPAEFTADIGRDGAVVISQAKGIRKFVIWLERDLIDWSRPVRVRVNGTVPPGFKAKKLEPDLHLMFEELYRTGDKKMLYMGMIEVNHTG